MENKFASSRKLGQYFNFAGLRFFLRALLCDRRLFVPHLRPASLAQLDFKALHSRGFRFVLFDKDNTITAAYAAELHPEAEPAVRECLRVFGKANVAVISNSAGSSDDPGYQVRTCS